METKTKNNWLGAILGIIGAGLGIGLNIMFFLSQYKLLMDQQLAQFPTLTNWKVIKFLLPVFSDLGILAGVMYFISAYGFILSKKWAYKLAVVANVFALQFSFWPMIPAMDLGLSPVYALIFLPNMLIYFLLHRGIGDKPWSRVFLGLITGMTLVTAYINGTACLNIYWMKTSYFHLAANRMHWVVAISFAAITVSLMVNPKEWTKMLGFGMAFLEIALGTPMGIMTTIEKGEFSMFLAAPILCTIYLIMVLFPKLWNKVVKPD